MKGLKILITVLVKKTTLQVLQTAVKELFCFRTKSAKGVQVPVLLAPDIRQSFGISSQKSLNPPGAQLFCTSFEKLCQVCDPHTP